MVEHLSENPCVKLTHERATATSMVIHRILGAGSVMILSFIETFIIYYYVFSPLDIAKKIMGKSGRINFEGVNKHWLEEIKEQAKKTIAREYTPFNLSQFDEFWHNLFAIRALSKVEQGFFLAWSAKELVNLSMYLNATAHERAIGLNTVNWELLGASIAYFN